MKKYGSTNANDRVAKNTPRKMLSMPCWAYWVQIWTTRFESSVEGLGDPVELDVLLDELHRTVGAVVTACIEAPVNQ